jgi:hypothetical protein
MSNCSTSFAQAAYPIAPKWNATTGGRFYPYHGNKLNPLPASSDNNWVSPPIGLVGGKKRKTRKHKKHKKHSKSKKRHNKKTKHHKKYRHHKKRKSRKMKGGYSSRNRLLQPLNNAFRQMQFNGSDVVNQWQGKVPTLSPSPAVQEPVPNANIQINSVPNLTEIHQSAGQAVANI